MELVPARVVRVIGPLGDEQQMAGVIVSTPEKAFLIVVGLPEASAIIRELEQKRSARPLTHDLIFQILGGFDICVKQVVISSLIEDTFCATLVLERDGDDGTRDQVMVDARASDSIVCALKARLPLLVSRQVLDRADDISSQIPGLQESLEAWKQEDESPGESAGWQPPLLDDDEDEPGDSGEQG